MTRNWSDIAERGSALGLSFVAGVYRLLGHGACRILLIPIAVYFYLTGREQREASADYLQRAWKAGAFTKKPGVWQGFRHFLTFSYATLDKFAAWNGDIRPEDVDGVHGGLFDDAKTSGRGAVVLTAHLGNPEVVRAVATMSRRFRVNVLMHTLHAEKFNRIIQRVSPDSPVRIMQVSQIDLGVAMQLASAIENGEWVVMTGDRVAVNDASGSSITMPFLGADARFPIGPFILAATLKCPAFTMFTMRKKNRYVVNFELLGDPVVLPRASRTAAIRGYLATYIERLERALIDAPYQWFNFYDYWRQNASPDQPNGRREVATHMPVKPKTEHEA